MKLIYLTVLVMCLHDLELQGQPEIILDVNETDQFAIISGDPESGAKLNLFQTDNQFLWLASTQEDLGLFYPTIIKFISQPLSFIAEDYESTAYQEQMQISPDGDLKIRTLADTAMRMVSVDADGKIIRNLHFGEYSGLYTATSHDFVSFTNPGDDHNYDIALGAMKHEEGTFGSGTLCAPVHLTQSAIIKQINVYYFDQDMDDTFIAYLLIRRNNSTSITLSDIHLIGHSDDTTSDVGVLSNNDLSLIVDNELFQYYIYIVSLTTDIGIVASTVFYY